MRFVNRIIIVFSIIFLTLVSFQSVVYAESLNKTEVSSQLKRPILQSYFKFDSYKLDDQTHPLWFPGFLIVQLIKGVMAFIIILLILFDIIEPNKLL